MSLLINLNIIGIIFISGILTSGYWMFFFDPGTSIKEETKNLASQVMQTDKKIRDKKRSLAEAVQFDDSVKKLGKEIEELYKLIPKQLSNRQMFQDLARISKESGLEVLSMKGSQNQKSSELYEALGIQLAVEGEFSQLLTFLSKLTSLDKIVTVKNVNIQPVTQSKSNSKIQKIKAQVSILGFRYSATVQDEISEQKGQT